jgi:hypothetical protein
MREDFNSYWSFALLTNLYSKDIENNIDSFTDSLSLGTSFSTATYAKDNSLNLVKIKLDADVLDIGDSDNRQFCVGSELKFQFLRNYSLSVMGGATIPADFEEDTTMFDASVLFSYPSSSYLIGTEISLATLLGNSSAFTLYVSGEFTI